MCVYVEHLLSRPGREHLSSEPIAKVVPRVYFNKENKVCFLAMVAISKGAVWKTCVKGIVTSTFIYSLGLFHYLIYSLKTKIRLERKGMLPGL